MYCKMSLADISTKALSTKRKYTQISIYKMLGIYSRNVCFVFVRGKKKLPMNTNSAPKPPWGCLSIFRL